MVSQGLSFTIVFLLATLISLGEANYNNRKLLYTPNKYQKPVYSPLPSPVHSPPVALTPPPPPTPVIRPTPQGYKPSYYKENPSPPPPSTKSWWWLL
ncbi:unnamed protein product [Cochlearia groenlandica]